LDIIEVYAHGEVNIESFVKSPFDANSVVVNSLSITLYITQDLYVNDQGVVQLHPFFMMGMQSRSPKSAVDHEVPMHKRRTAKTLSLKDIHGQYL
jgi:hypothetical protein